MCVHAIFDGVYLRSVRQSLVILNLKGNGSSFLALQTTGIYEQEVN